MTDLFRIADALSRPLLFHPTKLEVILSALDGRLPGLESAAPGPEASRFMGRADGSRPYRIADGIAFIPVVGSLANRGAYIGASSGITSYEGIAMQIRHAGADPSVHSLVFDIDSPGGEATGMFRLADLIRQVRASKRVVAFVDDMAASAAYGIASQAHEIVISPSSIVGSIGVVLTHVDRSAEMEKAGRKVTLIHAGARKVDGHSFGPLSDQVRQDLQAEVGVFYEQFLTTVAAGRSRLSREAARATEARTLIGQAAIAAGLADRIGTLESIVADLRSRASTRHSSQPQPASSAMTSVQPVYSHLTNAPYASSQATPWTNASAPAAAPVAPAASEKRNRLRLAVEDLVRRDAGQPPLPRESSTPKTGLMLAVEEMIANDQARCDLEASTGHQATPRGGGGLRAAVDAMIEEDRRRGR
ncbi:S49 family peptidase [Methylorubrum populi]|uniref:S49 family peptidase n=1 Tax=Methylorubrum populi TaxID=223967 RepID=UPI003F6560CF